MARPVTLRVALAAGQRADLQQRLRQQALSPRLRRRLECIRLADQGWPVPQIAAQLGLDQAIIRRTALSTGRPLDQLPGHSYAAVGASLAPHPSIRLMRALRVRFAPRGLERERGMTRRPRTRTRHDPEVKMHGRLAVLKTYGEPLVIEEYEVPDPEPGAL
jgi:hypothetical protein